MRQGNVVLSARMLALTQLVAPGSRVCDVGCDHGFVSIYLVQKGISDRVLAMDVRSGPLSRAREHIGEWGLGAYIETRLSDGLLAMRPGEADACICAGMGGRLIRRILTEGRDKARAMRELILQPQSEVPELRAYLRAEGYVTIAENMVYEDGKYYPMMKVVPGEPSEQNAEPEELQLWDAFGKLLLCNRHPVLLQYLEHLERKMSELEKMLREQESIRAEERLVKLRQERQLIARAKTFYYEINTVSQDMCGDI